MANRSHPGTGRKQRARELGDALASLYFVARRDYGIDLSHHAIRVLQLVAFGEKAPRIDDVARVLGRAASTASELVKRLQNKGLLVRRRTDKDERVVRLELTAAGRTALTEHTSCDPQKLEAGLAALPAAEQRELVRLIKGLSDAVQPAPTPR